MGQCCSGHEEAKATELGPPKFGSDIKVRLKKQGYFDADFDVIDISGEEPATWMLVDAVGGISDSAYDYYLKYRPKDQEESTVLGCANLKKEHDYMWFRTTYHRARHGRRHSYHRRNWIWHEYEARADTDDGSEMNERCQDRHARTCRCAPTSSSRVGCGCTLTRTRPSWSAASKSSAAAPTGAIATTRPGRHGLHLELSCPALSRQYLMPPRASREPLYLQSVIPIQCGIICAVGAADAQGQRRAHARAVGSPELHARPRRH